MAAQRNLQSSIHTTSELGNAISGQMLSFLNTVKDQPLGFRSLGLDFLAISQILNTLEQSLSQSAEPFPTPAIPELIKLITKVHQDFVQLKALLEKFLTYERGGLYAKMQKTWRLLFADKEIGKCNLALQEAKGGLRMMMVFIKADPDQKPKMKDEYQALAEKLEGVASDQPTIVGAEIVRGELPSSDATQQLPIESLNKLTVSGDAQAIPKEAYQPPSAASEQHSMNRNSRQLKTPTNVISRAGLTFRAPKSTASAGNVSLQKALFSGVKGQKPKVVEQLLDRGVLPDCPDLGLDENPILHATWLRDTATLTLLLQFGGDPNLGRDSRGNAPLILACRDKRDEQATLLLDWGADPNTCNEESPALAYAVDGNGPETVLALLQHGADTSHPVDGYNGLVHASHRDVPEEVLGEILAYSADLNIKNCDGFTPLQAACRWGRDHNVKMLLEDGAEVNLKGGEYPVFDALRHPKCLTHLINAGADLEAESGLMEPAVHWNCLDSIRLLLDAGYNPNVLRYDTWNPLTTAIRNNNSEAFQLLISRGADPNFAGEGGPPLHMALRHVHYVPALLEAGADPKTESCTGILETAVFHDNLQAVTALVEKGGVDINQAFENGNRPLCTAIRDDRFDIFTYLLSKGADPNLRGPDHPFIMALRHPQYLSRLAAAGADPRHENCKGLMELAVYANNMETIRILAEEVKIDLNEQYENGNAPLTTCVRDKRSEIMSYLLSRGADPNAPGANTLPLIWAASLEDGTMLNLLLKAGADVNKRAREGGNTPLIEASWHGRVENCRALLEKGADLNEMGENGQGALDVAANKGWDGVVEVLLEHMG